MYEMMPILYALVKSTNGDIDAAYDNINEGKITWKTKDPECPKVWSLIKHPRKLNGYDHNRIITIEDKPDDSGSEEDSRKSFDKVKLSETPKPRDESNEEAKDLSINSSLNRERYFYEKMFPFSLEEYRRSFASARVNFSNVTSLSMPHVEMPPFPNLMYADQERQAEFNFHFLNYYSARYLHRLQNGNGP